MNDNEETHSSHIISAGPQIRLDWTVSVWSLLPMLLQLVAIIWWASTLDSRVTQLEKAQALDDGSRNQIAVLMERTEAIKSDVRDIKDQLKTKQKE
jgi:hypothetical protein